MERHSTAPFALKHEHFLLDAYLRAPLAQRRMRPITQRLVADLLAALRMEPLGELAIFPAADQRAPGWSFLQPITTSHMSGHYFLRPGRHPHIRMDVYSCESVDWREIIRVADRHLGFSAWRGTFIDRQIDIGIPRSALELMGRGAAVESVMQIFSVEEPVALRRVTLAC
jgi:hypothetical protein